MRCSVAIPLGLWAGLSQECGEEGTRTPDLVNANHALSQLSYIPVPFAKWAYLDSNQGPQLYQSCALAN